MDARSAITSPPGSGGRCLAIAPAVAILLATGAHAQTSSCDDFKAVLAARFESNGVRGYSMEAVPARTPVPSGARVIGTCESGAFNILYRRWGAVRASSAAAASAAPAASAAQAAAVPDAQPRRAPGTRAERATPALPAAVPGPAPAPMARSNQGAASAAVVVASAPTRAPAGSASDVVAIRPIDKPLAEVPATAKVQVAPEAQSTLTQRASGFAADHWRWLAALALVAVASGIWLWRTYFSAYDKDGLPRGPRL